MKNYNFFFLVIQYQNFFSGFKSSEKCFKTFFWGWGLYGGPIQIAKKNGSKSSENVLKKIFAAKLPAAEILRTQEARPQLRGSFLVSRTGRSNPRIINIITDRLLFHLL